MKYERKLNVPIIHEKNIDEEGPSIASSQAQSVVGNLIESERGTEIMRSDSQYRNEEDSRYLTNPPVSRATYNLSNNNNYVIDSYNTS